MAANAALITEVTQHPSASNLEKLIDVYSDDDQALQGSTAKDVLRTCVSHLEDKDAALANNAAQLVYLLSATETQEVISNLNAIVAAIANAPSERRGFLGVTCAKLARRGHAQALIAASGIKHLGALLKDTDTDVVIAGLEALADICESGLDAAKQVDASLGFQTFTDLFATGEPEIKAGTLHLIAQVARIPSSRPNILADKALVGVITDALAQPDVAGGAVAALHSLSLSDATFLVPNANAIYGVIDPQNSVLSQVTAALLFARVLSSINKSPSPAESDKIFSLFEGDNARDAEDVKLYPEDLGFAFGQSAAEPFKALSLWAFTHATRPKASIDAWKAALPQINSLIATLSTSSDPRVAQVAKAAQVKAN